MKIYEILLEKKVLSSWITDITYTRPTKTIAMRLANGRVYNIVGPTRTTFEKWHNAPSKGRFFHLYIKGRYSPSLR